LHHGEATIDPFIPADAFGFLFLAEASSVSAASQCNSCLGASYARAHVKHQCHLTQLSPWLASELSDQSVE